MNLLYLCKKCLPYHIDKQSYINHQVTRIVDHTSYVVPGSIFFAFESSSHSEEDFIEQAIELGAKTIVHMRPICNKKSEINYIYCSNPRILYGKMLKIFYKDISKSLCIIGITGTNGKTSVAKRISEYLKYEGNKVLSFYTHEIYLGQEKYDIEETTPDLYLIYEFLLSAKKNHIYYVVMEISSHSIKQNRIYGLDFNIGIFMNLSQDHLDYHKTLEDYRYTKSMFLSSISNQKNHCVILNIDDESYPIISKYIQAEEKTFSTKNPFSTIYAYDQHPSYQKGYFSSIIFEEKKYLMKSFFLGEFQVYNDLASILTIQFLGFPILHYLDFLKVFDTIPGRMEEFVINQRHILIDYAHTPESIEYVLSSLKKRGYNKITCILGAGGNRDREKRHLMGQKAVLYSDEVIFTMDNPRFESNAIIFSDLTKDLDSSKYTIIEERKKAILYAMEHSNPNEMIAILGRGNEAYQIIENKKIPFSDKEYCKIVSQKIGWTI